MENLKTLVLVFIGAVLILGFGIKSCTSKEVCDIHGLQCQYESTCNPWIIDLIFASNK